MNKISIFKQIFIFLFKFNKVYFTSHAEIVFSVKSRSGAWCTFYIKCRKKKQKNNSIKSNSLKM